MAGTGTPPKLLMLIPGGHWESIGNTADTHARILDYLAEDTW
jgi:hypothetical protein